jgi:hypothetical protein
MEKINKIAPRSKSSQTTPQNSNLESLRTLQLRDRNAQMKKRTVAQNPPPVSAPTPANQLVKLPIGPAHLPPENDVEPEISNRHCGRLEIAVTHSKQKIEQFLIVIILLMPPTKIRSQAL